MQFFQPYIFKSVSCLICPSLPPDVPGNLIDFAASVGFLSVTFTWTPPSFLGVPPTLDPADFIYYILDVRNDTDSVGGATVSHPTTKVVVNLTYPCEEYTATIFARNRQAGNGPSTMKTFTLSETSVWQPDETFLIVYSIKCASVHWPVLLNTCVLYPDWVYILSSMGQFWLHLFGFPQVPSTSVSLQWRTLSPTSSEQPVPTTSC